MEYSEFRFNNETEGNWSDCSVRLGGRLINKVEIFKYLRPIVQENGEIVDDVQSRIT